MYLLLAAIAATLLKFYEVGPFSTISWWWILGLYAATAIWWQVADATGWSRRKAMEREQRIKDERLERQRKQLKARR